MWDLKLCSLNHLVCLHFQVSSDDATQHCAGTATFFKTIKRNLLYFLQKCCLHLFNSFNRDFEFQLIHSRQFVLLSFINMYQAVRWKLHVPMKKVPGARSPVRSSTVSGSNLSHRPTASTSRPDS